MIAIFTLVNMTQSRAGREKAIAARQARFYFANVKSGTVTNRATAFYFSNEFLGCGLNDFHPSWIVHSTHVGFGINGAEFV